MSTPEVTVKITSLAHGGAGVGRHQDFVLFVPFTVPGDLVRAKIVSTKKNYAEAELLEVIEPSPHRRQAPCPVFGQCGGCQWQHVEYIEQMAQKQKIVEHALARIAKETEFDLKQIIPSPSEFNYRNRAQIRTHGSRLGFFRRESHELVEFDECMLLEKVLNEQIKGLRANISNQHPDKTSRIEISVEAARGFSQVNTKQNLQMQKYVVDAVGKPRAVENSLLDLYCGNGNFSLHLAEQGWDVYGIDSSRAAITKAREHVHGQIKAFYSCDDCTNGVRKLGDKNRGFQTIILDPPRVGADERLLKQLSKFRAQKMIYISCNPTTFARDYSRIKNHSDFRLKSIQPFDMFPQTFHVELVAILELPKTVTSSKS